MMENETNNLKLNNPEAFATTFLNEVLRQGFQSLGKRDLELLIFYLLEKDGTISRNSRNHEIARLLRIPESRLKLLRKDSYARWQAIDDINQTEIIKYIFSECFTEEKLKQSLNHASSTDKSDGFIPIRVEHPAYRTELENEVINVNGIPKYERNREVLLIRFEILLKIAEKHGILKDQKDMETALKKLGKKSTTLAELLAKDVSELSISDFRSALNDTLIKIVTKPIDQDISISAFLQCLILI